MLYSTKVISASGNLMLNICDPELVGKTLNILNSKNPLQTTKNLVTDSLI